MFRWRQRGQIFSPNHGNPDKMRPPGDYAELAPYNVSDRRLSTGPRATITLWEKKGAPGQPHIIIFTGRSGHIADTGTFETNPVEGYERDAGLKFLQHIAKSGAGFTVVTLRGYGNNGGKPKEKGFRKDIRFFVDDWMAHKDHPPAERVVICGISLGTATATIAAAEMTRRGIPPAVLSLTNPFTSMAKLASQLLEQSPVAQKHGLRLSPETIERHHMLKHPFRTEETLHELSPGTTLHIAVSDEDTLIHPEHGKRLAETGRQRGLQVIEQHFPGRNHYTVPTGELVRGVRQAYDASLQHRPQPSWVGITGRSQGAEGYSYPNNASGIAR